MNQGVSPDPKSQGINDEATKQYDNKLKTTHRGARTHDHKVKGLALYRLS